MPPIDVTNHYTYSGPVKVKIYTEHELATVLEMTVDELKRALERGEYQYHVHPGAEGSGTPGKSQFTERDFLANVERKVKRDRASRLDSQRANDENQ